MNDSRLLDCSSVAEIEANLLRMIALIDSKMEATKILWWTPVNAATATGTLTVDTLPTAGDSMTIGTEVYVFMAAVDADTDGEIPIGADLATTQASIKAAINGTDGINAAHPVVTCSDFAANVATITAKAVGPAGNVATTETFQSITNVFGAASLEGGMNGTVGTEGQIMIDANKIYVCTADNTITDANWKSAALT